jgi:hypothetical protein
MEVFESCMECHERLSGDNQYGKSSQSLVLLQDFLILSVFSRVVKHDARALSTALGLRYPVKGSFLDKLANVLDSVKLGSFVDWKQESWDIQELPHVIAKFCRANELEGKKQSNHGHLLKTLKASLHLYYQNEVFQRDSSISTAALANLNKGTVGFVAKNVKFSDAGDISEFLHCFWNLVMNFHSIFEACLKGGGRNSLIRLGEPQESLSNDEFDEYAKLWLDGMKIPLWGKRLNDLCGRKCTGKLPNEKVIANINLLIQWISEKVLPVLRSMGDGIASSNELKVLLEKCFKTIDHSGDHNLLQRNKILRGVNEFRPFLTIENASSLELLMR